MVKLDNHSLTGNGFSSRDIFNATLFNVMGLDGGEHHLVLQNEWTNSSLDSFDVDYVVVTVGDGNSVYLYLSQW